MNPRRGRFQQKLPAQRLISHALRQVKILMDRKAPYTLRVTHCIFVDLGGSAHVNRTLWNRYALRLFLLQPVEQLRPALRIGPDGARGLAEHIDGARSGAKVRQAIGTLVRDVFPDDRAGFTRQRSDQAEFVIFV